MRLKLNNVATALCVPRDHPLASFGSQLVDSPDRSPAGHGGVSASFTRTPGALCTPPSSSSPPH